MGLVSRLLPPPAVSRAVNDCSAAGPTTRSVVIDAHGTAAAGAGHGEPGRPARTSGRGGFVRRSPGRRDAGFTLVELVTAVVILGVLVTVALHHASGRQRHDRAARADALAGSMRAAAAMIKAQAVASATSCGSASVTSTRTTGVTLDGRPIDLNHCYPQAVSGARGILGAAHIDPRRDGVAVPASGAGSGGAAAGTSLVLQILGARTPAECQVTYTSPFTADGQPTVAVVDTGC